MKPLPIKCAFVLVEMRSVLYAHRKVDPDPARVLSWDSVIRCVGVFVYVHAADCNEFLEISEDLLRIMDVVAPSATGFVQRRRDW